MVAPWKVGTGYAECVAGAENGLIRLKRGGGGAAQLKPSAIKPEVVAL
jgi:hypothetical protein